MKSERRRPPSVCCIPSTDSDNAKIESATDRSNNRCRYLQDSDTKCCDGVLNNDSTQHKMVIKSGPYGLHAIASQDIKAGCVILQCLPLAHSILVPPGGMMGDIEEEEEDDGSRRKKICSRCFIQEGDTNIGSSSENPRKKNFGRCSKCRMIYYCSRSCQVCSYVHEMCACELCILICIDSNNMFKFHLRYRCSHKIGSNSTNLNANTMSNDGNCINLLHMLQIL